MRQTPLLFPSRPRGQLGSRIQSRLRSPLFKSTVMSVSIASAASFSQRPGITCACAGMESRPTRIKTITAVREFFIETSCIDGMFTPTTILPQGECKLQCTRGRFLMDSAWTLHEVFMNREKYL